MYAAADVNEWTFGRSAAIFQNARGQTEHWRDFPGELKKLAQESNAREKQ